MKMTIAFIIGIFAVILYLLGYLQKKRMNIILLNASSRFLYILQYLILGAFEGAVLDIAGIISSLLAPLKKYKFVRKYTWLFVVILDVAIVAAGLSLYKNVFSLFPIIGVLLHTSAFWIDDEKWIRRVSMAGSPFWLIYNFVSRAYGSCIGDVLSMVSLGISMVRYDRKEKLTVGVIHWDCSLPSETTFFGYHATKSLSPAKYRNITPYYADILGENKIDYHPRTVEEYDTELQYAIDAGIDYFAYCWYGDTPKTDIRPQKEDTGYVSDKVWELAAARKLHMKSALKNKIKLCAILPAHPMLETETDELAEIMEQSYYQKIDGKPLVYIFNEYDTDKIVKIKRACQKRGFTPYIAIIASQPNPASGKDYSETDGVCAYACIAERVKNSEEMFAQLMQDNEKRKEYGVDVIPFYTVGWDPSPRIDNLVPWIQYPEVSYAPLATEEELLAGAKKLTEWIKANPAVQKTGHIMTFAWNEFEEGGHICPTYGTDGEIDLSRLQAFKKVVKYWRENI